jgi:hypothetical protein
MSQNRDHAVIVGVQVYPGLTDLGGPENDARAFRDWVLSPTGGDVPAANVQLIVSSNYSPPFESLDVAKPVLDDIQRAFGKLVDLAEANEKAGNGLIAGRRLYIYMAGHGIEPQRNRTALLMANAKEKRFGFHILGKDYADYFYDAGFFDEILLFMDCCRDYFPLTPLTPVPFDPRSDPDAPDRVKCLYGFGTKWKRRSRERPIMGVTRGVFTATLLEGLRGAASDSNHCITAASLKNYVNENMAQFLDPSDLQDPEVPKQAEFTPIPNEGDGLIIVQNIPPPTYEVAIFLPAGMEAQKVEVRGPKISDIAAAALAPGPQWMLKLP